MTAMLKRVVVGLVVAVAEAISVVEVDAARRGARREVLLHQLAREAVDAGGHRGVGGEHAAGAHGLDRLGEREAARPTQLADALERQEAGVALVGVEHLRVEAERASARTPPMPSRISWRRRCSASPP